MIDVAQQTAQAAMDLVNSKLTRVIRYLATQNRDGSLPPALQHAVRIIESRKRLWLRNFNATFSTNTEVRNRALAELQLVKQDNGDVFRFCNGNHGVGRLDCMSCDFDYVEMNGFPVQKPLCAICPHCRAGVLHIKTLGEWPEGTIIDPVSKTSETKPEYICRRKCDNCSFSTEEKIVD